MPNDYLPTGIRVVEDKEGSVIMTDPSVNMKLLFTPHYFDRVRSNDDDMLNMGKKLAKFINNHRHARKDRARKNIEQVRSIDSKCAAMLNDWYGRGHIARIESFLKKWNSQNMV